MQRDEIPESSKVYISNLNMNTNEEEITKLFSEFGTIVSTTLKSRETGITFAFVEYESSKEAAKAVSEMDMKRVEGKELKVQFARSRGDFRGRDSWRGGDRGGSYGDRGGSYGDRDRAPRRDFGGGGSRTCYNCNKEGHFARECPEPRRPRDMDRGGDRGGYRGGDRGGDRDRDEGGYRGGRDRDRERDRDDGYKRGGDRRRKHSSGSSRSRSNDRHRKYRRRSPSSSRSR